MEAFEWRDNVRQYFGVEPEIDARVRFLRGVRIEGDCWIWSRRGKFSIGRQTFRPADMAYLMMKGPLAMDQQAQITCSNAKCCMPGHLAATVYVEHNRQGAGSVHKSASELAA